MTNYDPEAERRRVSCCRNPCRPRDEGVGLKFPNVGRAATQLAKFLQFSKLVLSDSTTDTAKEMGVTRSRCEGRVGDNVRFTPKSGHWNSVAKCPLCAKSRLMHCSILDRQIAPQ